MLHRIGSNAVLALSLLSSGSVASATKAYNDVSIRLPLSTPENNVKFAPNDKPHDLLHNKNHISEHLCCITNVDPGMVLASDDQSTSAPRTVAMLFEPTVVEFGTDNCATHHICNNLSLFISPPIEVENVGIRGVSGSVSAEGIGTIQFSLQDDDGKDHLITLSNVIYLPSAPKNLISISQ